MAALFEKLIMPISQHYQSRTPREQQVLLWGSIGLVLMLLYALVYVPVNDRLEKAQQRVEHLSEEARIVAQAAQYAAQSTAFTERLAELRQGLGTQAISAMQVDEQAGVVRWALEDVPFSLVVRILDQTHAAGLVLHELDVAREGERVSASLVVAYE